MFSSCLLPTAPASCPCPCLLSINRRVVGGRGLSPVVCAAHRAGLVDEEGAAASLAVILRRGRGLEPVADGVQLDLVLRVRVEVFLQKLLADEFFERAVALLLLVNLEGLFGVHDAIERVEGGRL